MTQRANILLAAAMGLSALGFGLVAVFGIVPGAVHWRAPIAGADVAGPHGADGVSCGCRAGVVKGSSRYSAAYRAASRRSASAENRSALKADPGRSAARCGGYWAFAASTGALATCQQDEHGGRDHKPSSIGNDDLRARALKGSAAHEEGCEHLE